MLGLYIHIPFCKAICSYCDFPKEIANIDKQNAYLKALIKEMEHYNLAALTIDTIYIGGGTPSALNQDQLHFLLSSIKNVIDVTKLQEYTIEANPNDITLEKAKLFYDFGVNRISLGVQTFNDYHLRSVNRKHTNNDVYHAINALHQAGIANINIDLIFNLPKQKLEDVQRDLETALTLNITHISYYSLILEENTKLYYDVLKKKAVINDEEIEAEMFETIIKTLKSSAFKHYEISNFAKEGYLSKHNLIYWRNHDYIGIGAGSHGKYQQQRYFNHRSVKFYIEQVNAINHGKKERYAYEPLRDTFLLGLRLCKGVNIVAIEKEYAIDLFTQYPKLKDYIKQELVEIVDNHLRLTNKGLLLGNEVFAIF